MTADIGLLLGALAALITAVVGVGKYFDAKHLRRVETWEEQRKIDRVKNDLDHGIVQGLLENLIYESRGFRTQQEHMAERIEEIHNKVVGHADDIQNLQDQIIILTSEEVQDT